MKVFITRQIPSNGIDLLRAKGLSLDIFEADRAITPAELIERAHGVEILLSLLTDKIDGKIMDAIGPKLKLIANYAVGFDNIDLKAAKDRGILVSNTPADEVSEAVAEHAVALIFGLAHRIVECDRFTREGKYHGWGPQMLLGTDVIRKTLGLIGGGAIGSMLARRMRDGFGVKIVYNDLKANPKLEKETGAEFLNKEELLATADFVSLHVPLLPSTRHLIGAEELKMMKSTAFLINTARGPVVDEKALIEALMNKTIAGAGLDVYECEPFIDCDLNDRLSLASLPNVILTPHTASATEGARQAMSRAAAANIIDFVEGRAPRNVRA